ncbi:MAG: penicillin-binding protein 2 [Candidatus Levyibacteriota bacterium]|nr:MAG: penicillin-binding protein 2 [Candidatus Levybacteria bacterium]
MTARLRFTFIFIIFCFFGITSRLFYWQVVKAEDLSRLGQSQYDTFIKLTPKRGEIKTSDRFSLVANKVSFLVFANPKEIKDKKKTADTLSSILHTDIASVSGFLSLDRFWVPIKSGVDNATKQTIEQAKVDGVGFEQQSIRFYPEGSMSAHLTGFVGEDDGGFKGYFGLEGYYDRQLRGKAGIAVQIKDALGRPILSKMNDKTGVIDGRNLVLSIDRVVQFTAEKRLKDGVEKYQAAGGMVGIMDPKTGNILAMVSYPSFDQQEFWKFDEGLYKNPFISNLYEPGSTFKSMVMAAGIDSSVVKPETKCPICAKSISIGGYEIRTWNDRYYPNSTMVDVIKHSDNIGMVYVGSQLGINRLLSYLHKFGIGAQTGIDLQGEVAQELRGADRWYPLDAATLTFGQGISVTPIQLLDAFSAIANDGKRMEPHVVAKIETPDDQTILIPPKVLEQPISPTTAKVMTEILVNAVSNGEAKWAKPKGYRIAGKTGTAQIPIAGHYDPNKTIASFIGFAPADNPKFAMLVIVDRPTTSIYGSETAAPIFFDIAKDLLTYYSISPTE